ncbi:hypothetical protein RND81_10G186500 [Saponaria officinalis]|uniref:Enhancer of polycomb-like protein n=1 Tax=Saponaria officinalis TaxID=3572 RepID=A0AAW1I5C5_SAPOF
MSRLSFRPRPLDIHKKLPIVKSFKDFEDDDTPSSTRNSQIYRLVPENDHEVHHVPSKKLAAEIPTPEFVVVDTYERDYSRSFCQPTSYIRARGARAEVGEFIEYDLDIEDEEWIGDFNKDKKILSPERFESILFKLEVLDHKARERAGVINQTLGSPIPVHLQLDAAVEALQAQPLKHTVLESVYLYWREKRERWQKPVLRRLQPPPPVNDTNPYNVFRPREKAHRLHTRRMQRRENNVQSFEKLRQVRRNLDQAKTILGALIKREEKKRDVMEIEVSLQRIQLKYKHEADLLDDSFVHPSFQPLSKFGSSEDELMDSEDISNTQHAAHPRRVPTPMVDVKPIMVSTGNLKHDLRWRNVATSWIRRVDPLEPVMPFTKPLLPDKLADAGIIPPTNASETTSPGRSYQPRGRIGRGGRIIFDRWNPLMHSPVDCGDSFYLSPKQ